MIEENNKNNNSNDEDEQRSDSSKSLEDLYETLFSDDSQQADNFEGAVSADSEIYQEAEKLEDHCIHQIDDLWMHCDTPEKLH